MRQFQKQFLGVLLWLVLAIVAFLGPAIAKGLFWAPSDGITQNSPLRALAAQHLQSGIWPFWNPYTWSGAPLLATSHVGIFFPGNWPYWLMPLTEATNWTLAFTLFVAGAGFALYARQLGLHLAATTLGATIWMLGGWMTQHTEHIQMIQVAGLTPWLLLFIDRCARLECHWAPMGLALIAAMQVFAGHPQMIVYSWLLAALYTLWRGFGLALEQRKNLILRTFSAAALAIGLSAPQWLVTLDYIADTQRRQIDFAWLSVHPVAPKSLAGLMMPYLFGARDPILSGLSPWWGALDWDSWFQCYVGVASLLPIAIACRFWRVEPAIRFWVWVGAGSLVLSFGNHTPLYRLWGLLPIVNQMPYANRHLMVVNLASALLAAWGLHHWLQKDRRLAFRELTLAGMGLLGTMATIWLVMAIWGEGYAQRIQGLLGPDIDLHHALNPWQWCMLAPAIAVLAAVLILKRMHGSSRGVWPWALTVLVAGDLLLFARLQGLEFVLPHQALARQAPSPIPPPSRSRWLTVTTLRYPNCYGCDIYEHLLNRAYPNVSILDGLSTINGYDAFLPGRYARALGMDSFGHTGEYNDQVFDNGNHVLDLLNLQDLLLEPAVATKPQWRKRLAHPRWVGAAPTNGLLHYQNQRACGQAWRVRVLTRSNETDIFQRLNAPDFNPAEEALLVADQLPSAAPGPGPVSLNRDSPNSIVLGTKAGKAGFVVVSEGYDRGWQALINGVPGPVYCVDNLIMGVFVPAGTVTIHLQYEPPLWRLACMIAGLSLLVLIGWLITATRRMRGQANPANPPTNQGSG